MPGGDTIAIHTECRLKFGLFDQTAKQDASYSSSNMMPFVSFADFKRTDEYEIPNPLPWPGLSWDGFDVLDDAWSVHDARDWAWTQIEGTGKPAGYWSRSFSNENGRFGEPVAEPTWSDIDKADLSWSAIDALDRDWAYTEGTPVPMIEANFSEDHSTAGITFKFATLYGEWPTELKVTWYDKIGSYITSEIGHPNGVIFFLEHKAEHYRKIRIEFYGTNKPNSQIKITDIKYGVELPLEGNDIIAAKLHEEVSAISAQLPINALDVKIQSDTSNFYILNPSSAYSLLQERQTIEVSEVVGTAAKYDLDWNNFEAMDLSWNSFEELGVAWEDLEDDQVTYELGTYYLNSMENESKSIIRIQAIDLMGMLDKGVFVGGVYANVTAGSLISEIMGDANAEYEIDSALTSIKLSGHIPICTHREALQQVVFAIGATASSARSNKIKITYPEISPKEVIPVSKKFYRKPIIQNDLITGVEVTSFTYAKGSEAKELLNDALEAGEYEVKFSEPVDPAANRLTVSNGTIIERNANRAVIRLDRRQDVVLTGYPYVVQTRLHGIYTEDLPSLTSPNIQTVDVATLISPDIGDDVAKRLYDYAQRRHEHTFGMVCSGQSPGDVMQVRHVDGGQVFGMNEVMDTNLTGGFRSDITLHFAYVIESAKWSYTRSPAQLYSGDSIGGL